MAHIEPYTGLSVVLAEAAIFRFFQIFHYRLDDIWVKPVIIDRWIELPFQTIHFVLQCGFALFQIY